MLSADKSPALLIAGAVVWVALATAGTLWIVSHIRKRLASGEELWQVRSLAMGTTLLLATFGTSAVAYHFLGAGGLFVGPTLTVLASGGRPSCLGFEWIGLRLSLLWVGLGYLLTLPLIIIASLLQSLICDAIDISTTSQPAVQLFQQLEGLSPVAKFAFLAVVIAPVAEETFFRGFLHGWLRGQLGIWPSVLISAASFAAIHNHLPTFLPLMVLGGALALVYELSGSLWSCIGLHSLFNGMMLLILSCYPELIA